MAWGGHGLHRVTLAMQEVERTWEGGRKGDPPEGGGGGTSKLRGMNPHTHLDMSDDVTLLILWHDLPKPQAYAPVSHKHLKSCPFSYRNSPADRHTRASQPAVPSLKLKSQDVVQINSGSPRQQSCCGWDQQTAACVERQSNEILCGTGAIRLQLACICLMWLQHRFAHYSLNARFTRHLAQQLKTHPFREYCGSISRRQLQHQGGQ